MPADELIPLVLCIDVEPDEQHVARNDPRPWRGFEAAVAWAQPIRDELARITGRPANFSWFLRMDQQVTHGYGEPTWVAHRYADHLAVLKRDGDELGLHPHAWRWDDEVGWIVDLADGEFVSRVVQGSFHAYRDAFGETCRAHRFGDGYLSDGIIDQIMSLGVKVDVTAEPGMTHVAAVRRGARFRGGVPYSAGATRTSQLITRNPDESGHATRSLVLIPLASADPDSTMPAWRRIARRLRYAGQPLHRQLVLSLPWPAARFWNLIARDVERGELDTVAFGIRSSTFTDKAAADLIAHKLRGLAFHPLGKRLSCATASAAADLLRARSADAAA